MRQGMEIASNTMASREISINKQNTGQDILQKTLEKTVEAEQMSTSKPVQQVSADKQGSIDLYA